MTHRILLSLIPLSALMACSATPSPPPGVQPIARPIAKPERAFIVIRPEAGYQRDSLAQEGAEMAPPTDAEATEAATATVVPNGEDGYLNDVLSKDAPRPADPASPADLADETTPSPAPPSNAQPPVLAAPAPADNDGYLNDTLARGGQRPTTPEPTPADHTERAASRADARPPADTAPSERVVDEQGSAPADDGGYLTELLRRP